MEDLIRRGAVLGKLDELSEFFRRRSETEDKGFLAVQCGVAFAIEEVKEAPSVDAVEVVHARWTRKDNSQNCKRIGDFEEWYECSACEGNSEHESIYCPDCGARMDVEAISKTETTTREKEAKQDG